MARFNVRPQGGDGPMYCPARDVAHFGRRLVGRALDDLFDGPSGDWLRALGAPEEPVGRVAVALAGFFQMVPREDVADVTVAWDKSGLTTACRADFTGAVVLAAIGQRFLMAAFNGLRDVTALEDPAYETDAKAFLERVEVALAYRALPRWRRALYRLLPAAARHARVRSWWESRQPPRVQP